MVKLYTNKPEVNQAFNWKALLYGVGIITVLLFILYQVYKSNFSNDPEAHFVSEVMHQYANIYHLKSTIFHKSDKKINLWMSEVKEIMLEQIYSYCDVAKDSIQKPITSRITHKDRPNWLLQTNRYYQITATTEFECKEAAL